MLAKQIEQGMDRASKECALYQNEHCALYEKDLEQICPRKDKDRRKKLIKFAEQYGFRLGFYREGLFAIFGKRAPAGGPITRILGGGIATRAGFTRPIA